MTRRRKNYGVAETVITADSDLDPIVVRFGDQPDRPARVFDFGEFADFPPLFRAFAGDRHSDALRRTTRTALFRGLRQFFSFLREQRAAGMRIVDAHDVTGALLRAYATWLQRRRLTIRTQAHYYGTAVRVIGELRRSRATPFGHIAIPRRQFPGVGLQRTSQPMRKLDGHTMQALREAAWADVQAAWSDFSHGRALLDEATARLERQQRPPDLRELGELLVYIQREHRGVVPRLRHGHDQHLAEVIKKHGGTDEVARYLHATPETLAPFFVLIGADTFANADALRLFRRDCVRPDPLFEGSHLVRWHKARSTGEQQRQLSGTAPSSVPQLVERLLALTERLVPHARPDERQYLFLSRLRKRPDLAGLVKSDALHDALRRLVARHNLRGPDGNPLRLRLGMLRSTGLTLLYRKRRDLVGVSRAAGHSSLGVTVRYVLDPETEREHDRLIARRQNALGRLIDGAAVPTGEPLEMTGRHAQAVGFACADPMAGRGPRSRPGELCPEWLWPLTDPGLVIPHEPAYLARVLHLRRHLRTARHQMRRDRFDLIYQPLLGLIDNDVLPRFTDARVIADAESLADTLAPLPDLTTA